MVIIKDTLHANNIKHLNKKYTVSIQTHTAHIDFGKSGS